MALRDTSYLFAPNDIAIKPIKNVIHCSLQLMLFQFNSCGGLFLQSCNRPIVFLFCEFNVCLNPLLFATSLSYLLHPLLRHGRSHANRNLSIGIDSFAQGSNIISVPLKRKGIYTCLRGHMKLKNIDNVERPTVFPIQGLALHHWYV
jgi:hypothetical protein